MEPFTWTTNPFATITTGMPPYPMPLSTSFPEPRRKDPERKKMDGTNYTNNPRDNLVTMIAFTAGEEGYDDTNNNGKYDDGEPYDRPHRALRRRNDDGTWCGDNNSEYPCSTLGEASTPSCSSTSTATASGTARTACGTPTPSSGRPRRSSGPGIPDYPNDYAQPRAHRAPGAGE